jgi:cellulose synthase/poly-beta-1,6-N-acetylglucosamine synthase-like glycosyltransferase
MVIDSWSLVLSYWFLVPGSWFRVPGSWSLVLGSWFLIVGLGYVLLIGFFTLGWYRKTVAFRNTNTSDNINDNCNRKVSVVVAARDEEEYIAGLLNDLINQYYPEELLEIIIVDDHSSDRTYEVVADFIKQRPGRIILLKNEDDNRSGKKSALAYGIARSIGDIILTTDADCRVGARWISSLMASFNDEKIKMVFGTVTYFSEKGFSDDFQSMEFAGLVASGAGAALNGHPFLCNGASLAYRKDAFLQVNGFEGNEKYLSGDDVFLLHKMKKTFGRKSIIFCKDEQATVKTYPAPGLRKFINQRTRWASKSKAYRDFLSIITALIVFSYSLIVLFSFITGFFNPVFFLLSGGLFLLKMIADFPLMLGITGFTRQRRLLKFFVLFQTIYPFYIVIAGILSLVKRNKW